MMIQVLYHHLIVYIFLTFVTNQWRWSSTSFAIIPTLPSKSHGLSINFHHIHKRDQLAQLSLSKSSFMDRLHGESDDAYFKRILAVAADAKSFENAVVQRQSNGLIQDHSSLPSLVTVNSTSSEFHDPPSVPAKSRYVRAEDWDAEEQRKSKSGSWEERVQFDGQRHGNRFAQNEILRHNLKAF